VTRATFRCDSCGTMVPLQARSCPKCAKTFDAVRCPRCGHIGDPPEFADGCPSCGYLASSSPAPRPPRRSRFVPVMAVVLVLLAAAVAYAWVLRGA